MIRVLHEIKGGKGTEYAIKALEAVRAKEEKADGKPIRQNMRLYHAD
jgi:hypothetical protein